MLVAVTCGAESRPSGRAYFEARKHQTQYSGPERDVPNVDSGEEILIAYFGPSAPADPVHGGRWNATQLALRHANQNVGHDKKRIRFVPVWSASPWGTGIRQLARTVYDQPICAVLGGADSPSTHLAEQVAAKAHLPLVCAASSDKSINLANVPWMFSLLPGDHLICEALAPRIAKAACDTEFTFVSATDPDSRHLTSELLKALARLHQSPQYSFPIDASDHSIDDVAKRFCNTKSNTLVLLADARKSAIFLHALHERHRHPTVFGGPAIGQRCFAASLGDLEVDITYPQLWTNDTPESHAFTKTYTETFHQQPDYLAAYAYDAATLLIHAIRSAGLNRARIRDALADTSPWLGVTGVVEWDPLGSNRHSVHCVSFHHGDD